MKTGAIVQGVALAGAAFTWIVAGGCSSERAGERVGSKAPSLTAAEAGADAGVARATDAGTGAADAGLPPPEPPGDAGASQPRVYLLSEFAEVDGGAVTYFDTATAGAPAALSGLSPARSGFQVADSQLLVAHGSSVFVTDGAAPVLQRYNLDASGRLVPGPSLSFASVGVPAVLGWRLVIVSDSKAYLFDEETERAYVWNPQTMQLTGASFSVAVGAREGYDFAFAPREARLRGDVLFVPAYWYEENEFFSLRTTAALVIDTTRDRVIQLAEDERCAAFSLAMQPSGDIYAFPDGFFAQEFYLDRPVPRRPLCALRIRAGQVGFDPSYVLDLGALVGGDEVSGGAVQGGIADGLGGIYLSVADERRYLDGADGVFKLWRWDLQSGVAEEVPDMPYWWPPYMGSYANAGEVFAVLPGVESTAVLPLSQRPVVPFELPGWIEPFTRLR